jgi:hypothetical protein
MTTISTLHCVKFRVVGAVVEAPTPPRKVLDRSGGRTAQTAMLGGRETECNMAKDARGHGSNGRGGGYTKATDPAKRARQLQYIAAHYAAKRAAQRGPKDIAADHGIDTSHLQAQKPFDEAAANEAAKWM